MGDAENSHKSGKAIRRNRFFRLWGILAFVIVILLFLDDYKVDALAVRDLFPGVLYDAIFAIALLIYYFRMVLYYSQNTYEWQNEVLGGITSDEPERAATSLMRSFRRYAKTKREYQNGIIVHLITIYSMYLALTLGVQSIESLFDPRLYFTLVEFILGWLILEVSYRIGRDFRPAEVFMEKFIRMFYQVPATDPMSEAQIRELVREKLDAIKREHPSWFT